MERFKKTVLVWKSSTDPKSPKLVSYQKRVNLVWKDVTESVSLSLSLSLCLLFVYFIPYLSYSTS
jgi:hypothetical protein